MSTMASLMLMHTNDVVALKACNKDLLHRHKDLSIERQPATSGSSMLSGRLENHGQSSQGLT